MSERLNQIDIPSPCPVPWDSMKGDEKARRCEQCSCTVYDLSAMTKADGERLLQRASDGLCVQIVRAGDGSIVTLDSPPKSSRRRFNVVLSTMFAWITAGLIGCESGSDGAGGKRTGGVVVPKGQREGGKVAPVERDKPKPGKLDA